jgi:putative copper resistance protein D
MLAGKIALTALVLLLGALNFGIIRAARRGEAPALLPLRRFGEAELGIGFTILLAAASLTSAPPAIDVKDNAVTLPEIAARMSPKLPNLETPPFAALEPEILQTANQSPSQLQSFAPGETAPPSSRNLAFVEWSEYNHHWAGLVVAAMGLLSLLARRFRWARAWPLVFLGLAAFLFVRADAEYWPLGPRGFWGSFQVAEVAQHRVFVLLIVAFAAFEWAVQTERISPRRAGLVFPAVCAAGGALLLTHSHSLGNVKEEFLAELSHLPIAILGVMAGWSRWLEIRLPERYRLAAVSWIWPACFVCIGAILICYREH